MRINSLNLPFICSLHFLLNICNNIDQNKPASNKLRLQISAGWLIHRTEYWNTKVALNLFTRLKHNYLNCLQAGKNPSFLSVMLHAFRTRRSIFYIFIMLPCNNRKLLPELWCFNNSFWISRKFSRQPRVISKRRSKAALLANWNRNKAILQVELKQSHVHARERLHYEGGICRVVGQVGDLKMNISVLLQQLKCKLIHPSQECTSH